MNIPHYAPLLVAVVGLSTFAGLWGFGTALLQPFRLHLPSPWSSVVAVLLAIQILSLVVQVAGMLGGASRFTLSAIGGAVIAVGGIALLVRARERGSVQIASLASAAFPLAIVSTALLADLLVATAPSTKIDELYYHMLVPSRIVSDGAIHFYRMPWEAAVWPQMAYQISAAPLHAIGYPDAANVVSWTIGAMLIWFAWRTILTSTASPLWSVFWAVGLCVGIYPVRWHVTGGAHAMGDLAMAAAIVAFADRDRLLAQIARPQYAAMLSILLVSAATSKVSLVPACSILLTLSAWHVMHSAPTQITSRTVMAFALPWLIFYCPILIWTWIQSGSPFGPILAGTFGSSIYSQTWLAHTFQEI